MTDAATAPRPMATPRASLERWPTGAKLLIILSVALLPLALIAVFATLRTTQIADTEARARLRVAAAESSRAIAIELIGDMTALRVAADALEVDRSDSPTCARVEGVFAPQFATGTRFTILDRRGRVLCGAGFPDAASVTRTQDDLPISAKIVPGHGLILGVASRSGNITAAAMFPVAFIRQLSRPSGFVPNFATTLVSDGDSLSLQPLAMESPLERRETNRTALGIGDLQLEMQVRSAPISSPLIIAMLLPLIMWAAASAIAWFVVDRLLIRPLRQLRHSVATFTPGEEIDTGDASLLPAQEIRELGDTFRAISRTVALHEAGLAEGLVRQTKLTREVHHRVKNNLQVISSLINFHARGAQSAEATQAYASIQRRVDALAVVHRHHYAEMEENRGLPLRSVLGELASNLRATAPDDSNVGITLEVEPFLVSQDTAVAIAFIVTETVELAMTCDRMARIRISVKPGPEGKAILRVSSPALIESEALRDGLAKRFGRVIDGLARQLRAPLHHDPLVGAYEIAVAVTGRD